MFVVRDAQHADLDALVALAHELDTVNLPADRAHLERVIEASQRSFARTDENPGGRYLFALEGPSGVCGVSMIIAAHGTVDDPHHYFHVDVDERYSKTLGTVFRHKTLQFRRSLTPHTEIGALILAPAMRGHAERLGRMLSFARFTFIAAERQRFHDAVQAELLPPFEDDGSSKLWEWLGRRFTGLSYAEADRLSSQDKDFARELFPRAPLYTSLWPPDVQELIGAVGPNTKGVARMLRRIGFRFNGRIDPFDGGPHFEAPTDDIFLIEHAQRGGLVIEELHGRDPLGLIGVGTPGGGFRVIQARFATLDERIGVEAQTLAAIGLPEGADVIATPFPPATSNA